MATLTWQNQAGNLGHYPAGSSLSLQFSAVSDDPQSIIHYKLLSGNLPKGTIIDPIGISLYGLLSGKLAVVYTEEVYYFTVRAYDQNGNIKDRTFNITIYVSNVPKFTVPKGLLITVYDSLWNDFQVQYTNPISSNQVTVTRTSGYLPPGLRITTDGKIQGYAKPPYLSSGSPTTKTYTFTLQLSSMLGNDSATYSITVINQQIVYLLPNRIPVIANSKPVSIPNETDPYYAYYLDSSNSIPTAKANVQFTFKIIGHDFDNDPIKYTYNQLPPGLSGDELTGWITGTPIMNSDGISDFVFQVSVCKLTDPTLTSYPETFKLTVTNNIVEDIVWETPEDLGVMYNHSISELFVKATSAKDLNYILYDGILPANLVVQPTGLISGRVAFQPSDTLLPANAEVEYVFSVEAYAPSYPRIRSFKTFKLTVKQYFNEPVENVYFKISPSYYGRVVLRTLLTNTDLIPDDYLYRPNDPYFGKSSDVKIVHAYGLTVSTLTSYMNALSTNYYNRDVNLGQIKTAVARDSNGDIVYEVVYAEVADDISGIPQEIQWPRPISLDLGPWYVNRTDIYTSYSFDMTYNTDLSPGSVRNLYPGSLDNMRNVLIENIGQNADSNLLPAWMTSQQKDGLTLGFVKCWVICYTLPDKADIIKSNIENNWEYTLSEIGCSLDRFYVDKSSTYNYNVNLNIPAWNELPSEVPNYTNPERNDLVVLFPRKTILPK